MTTDAAAIPDDATPAVQRLLDAIKQEDWPGVAALLARSPNCAHGYGMDGESPMLAALYRGQNETALRIATHRNLDIAEAAAMNDTSTVAARLQAAPECIFTLTPDGWTALHLAAFFGAVESAELLLGAGADVDARSQNGMSNTPLCAALAGRGVEAMIALLIARGADVNTRAGGGVTPLHLAASRGAISSIELLLTHGARLTATLETGQTPAVIARERGHEAAAAYLEATTKSADH